MIFAGPYLLSGGEEAVLVQWHLEKQDKSFVARVGHTIQAVSIARTYYGLTLGDNSVKVIRFDNNKAVVCKQGLDVSQICESKDSEVKMVSTDNGNLLINPAGSQL